MSAICPENDPFSPGSDDTEPFEEAPQTPEQIIAGQLPNDLSDDDELLDFLVNSIEHDYYDSGVDIFESNLEVRTMSIEMDHEIEDLARVTVEETWYVQFEFNCLARNRLGGKDGIDMDNSGTETGQADVNITRELEVLSSTWEIQGHNNEYAIRGNAPDGKS